MSANNNLIPPSWAKSAASLNVLVSLRHSLKMALRASGSTGTAISPTAALRRASDWSELSPEHSNFADSSKIKFIVNTVNCLYISYLNRIPLDAIVIAVVSISSSSGVVSPAPSLSFSVPA